MEPYAAQLPPPRPGTAGPASLVLFALLCGAFGPGWLIAMANGWVSPAPPRVLTYPLPALIPFVGVVSMVAGAGWFAALRAAATRTDVALVGLRLSIDGRSLQLDQRTRVVRDGDQLRIVQDGTIHQVRSEDHAALDALAGRLRHRIRNAGTAAEVPPPLRQLGRE